jgi:hypothetical protein
MTAQTRERLINSLISVCICIIISLFVLYTSKDYTRKSIKEYEKTAIDSTCKKLDKILNEIIITSNKLDSIK